MHHTPTTSGIRELQKRAIGRKGRKTGPISWEWDASGDCESPVSRDLMGQPVIKSPASHKWRTGADGLPARLLLHVRCRKCGCCLQHRRRLWRERARAELRQADRTWFGTLTYSPEEYFRALSHARVAAEAAGCPLGDMQHRDRYLLAVLNRHVTLMLKRLRESAGTQFRYLLVAERHKSGNVHFHALIHELSEFAPVRKSALDAQWPHGFCQWRLATPAAAAYIAKYATKALCGRIRASQNYGKERPPGVVAKTERSEGKARDKTTPSGMTRGMHETAQGIPHQPSERAGFRARADGTEHGASVAPSRIHDPQKAGKR